MSGATPHHALVMHVAGLPGLVPSSEALALMVLMPLSEGATMLSDREERREPEEVEFLLARALRERLARVWLRIRQRIGHHDATVPVERASVPEVTCTSERAAEARGRTGRAPK